MNTQCSLVALGSGVVGTFLERWPHVLISGMFQIECQKQIKETLFSNKEDQVQIPASCCNVGANSIRLTTSSSLESKEMVITIIRRLVLRAKAADTSKKIRRSLGLLTR